jgi:hypothetical protein
MCNYPPLPMEIKSEGLRYRLSRMTLTLLGHLVGRGLSPSSMMPVAECLSFQVQ